MTTRLARLWQPGNPQRRVFMPDFWIIVLETSTVGRMKLPKNCVKFEVDPRMSRHDVREYLTKIYNLPVRDVRTEVQMGDISWSTRSDYRYRKAMWKENDKKYAYVFMSKDFEFSYPNIFHQDEEKEELDKLKQEQEKISYNTEFVNRNRKKIGQFFGI